MAKTQNKPVSLETAQKKITPAKYNEYMTKLELRDVRLISVTSRRFDAPISESRNVSFDEKIVPVGIHERSAQVAVEYVIKAKSARRRVAEIRAKYLAIFETTERLPTEFFTIYNVYSLPLQTFPYLRECVHSLFQKMNLPPLVLPLRKYLIGKPQKR